MKIYSEFRILLLQFSWGFMFYVQNIMQNNTAKEKTVFTITGLFWEFPVL